MRPALSVFRLMWSSALPEPVVAASLALQVVSGSPSRWVVKYMCEELWLLHITPIRLPPKAITEDTSSLLRPVPVIAGVKGTLHVRSLPTVWAIVSFFAWVQVAQIVPVESLSMTRVSTATVVIVTGKPESFV